MPDPALWFGALPIDASTLFPLAIIFIAAIIAALLLHRVTFSLLSKFAARSASRSDDLLLAHVRRPLGWIYIATSLTLAQPALSLDDWGQKLWAQAAGFLLPLLVGWFAIAIVRAFADIGRLRADITTPNNLEARRKQTRIGILSRIAIFLILFLSVCMMLMAVPSVRSVGVTLIASAGLAGLAVGAAAQPALKNLIAGIQLAFTQPIRIDDVVIMDGEWGRIEEIWLTFVVVRIWDDRRLVVPITKFLEEPFQNWTRSTSELMGSVVWYLDPTADVDRLRAELETVIKSSPRWDGRFYNLQVTDMRPDSIELRALMTSKDASTAFDLRCDVREAMLRFIRDEMPEAMPRQRLQAQEDRRT